MALFGKKKEIKKETEKTVVKVNTSKALNTDYNLSSVILSPRMTEKSVNLGDQNVYTFNVRRDATKFLVRDAIKSLYKVTPVKINIVNKRPAKRLVGSRGKEKHVAGTKKAYVYLKKGDTINLV
jgi:large subunit ribosomal protein L23